jgi:4-hydroxy-2-oxoglutarate aldolase
MPLALHGILAPVVTTFDPQHGALARAPFERNLRAYLAAGVTGAVVAGSSGEAALLDDAERRTLTEWARAIVPADRALVVGVGSESTRLTIARAWDAAAAGADAVLVVAPHYYHARMTEPALRAHYEAVADASPVPVLLYNIPVYAHFAFSEALVHALAAHGNVAGMKDSAGDLPMLDAYLRAQSPTFRVLTGSGQTVQAALERGASGAILAVALFAPALTVSLADAVARGDGAAAADAQARLAPLAREIVAALGPAGLKAAMDLVGLEGGTPRPPLQPVTDAERARVTARLEEQGLTRVVADATTA